MHTSPQPDFLLNAPQRVQIGSHEVVKRELYCKKSIECFQEKSNYEVMVIYRADFGYRLHPVCWKGSMPIVDQSHCAKFADKREMHEYFQFHPKDPLLK